MVRQRNRAGCEVPRVAQVNERGTKSVSPRGLASARGSPVRRTHSTILARVQGETDVKKGMPVRKIRKFLSPKRNVDTMRIYYCYQLGSTFVSLGQMETRIVTAMMTCDRIKLAKVIQGDVPFWDSIAARHTQLQSSTLGNLLTILSKHSIAEPDLIYLRWVVAKRNFFIHRFFLRRRLGPAIFRRKTCV